MVLLDKALFTGQESVDPEEIVRCEVNNWHESVDNNLRAFQWTGGAVACIGLTLTDDNRKVHQGCLLTRGKMETVEHIMEARKVWHGATASTMFTLKLETVDIFQFTDGGLYSDYVCQENISHFVHTTEDDRNPRPVLAAKRPELGVGNFCLRMVSHVSSSSTARTGIWLKYHVLIFPERKDKMLKAFEAAKNPGWPGIKVCEGEMAVLPRPTVPWQCPILPLLWPGTPLEQLGEAPTATELRKAVGAIMSKAAEPNLYKTPSSLASKWEKIGRNPDELCSKAGPVTWPRQKEPERETGRYNLTGRQHKDTTQPTRIFQHTDKTYRQNKKTDS
jgi:hypothetical protein